MPTTYFKYAVESFLQGVGQGDITITLANPTTLANFSPQPIGYSLDKIYNYFLFSGQALKRALIRYTKNELNKQLPGFYKRASLKTLTSGVYTPTEAIEHILDPVTVIRTSPSVIKIATIIPDNLIESCRLSTGMRAVTEDYPGYYIRDGAINVLPTTYNQVSFHYISSFPRVVLSSVDSDVLPNDYLGMLVEGAIMKDKRDSNENMLEQFYYAKLQNSYKQESNPITNQTNSLIEQQ